MSLAGDIAEKSTAKTVNKMLKSAIPALAGHPAVKYGIVLHRFRYKQ
jgi:DNA replicative helicase MCM subunit Mcm2 (Cdc46/Mcm family)